MNVLKKYEERLSATWIRHPFDADGDNAPAIQWDERPGNTPASAWWVRVELKDGTKGWLRNPSSFDGMGPLS